MSQKISQKDDNPFAFFGALAEVFTACFPEQMSKNEKRKNKDRIVVNQSPRQPLRGGSDSSQIQSQSAPPSRNVSGQRDPRDFLGNLIHAFTRSEEEYEAKAAVENTIQMLSGEKEVRSGVLSGSFGRVAQPATELYTNVTGEKLPLLPRALEILDTILDIKVPDEKKIELSNALDKASQRNDMDQVSREKIAGLSDVLKDPRYKNGSTIEQNLQSINPDLLSSILTDKQKYSSMNHGNYSRVNAELQGVASNLLGNKSTMSSSPPVFSSAFRGGEAPRGGDAGKVR
jgi:hypothetical protein